jgi:LAGLIDADG DNA endonuclease family
VSFGLPWTRACLLGDGSLSKSSKGYVRISVKHRADHREYLEFKAVKLKQEINRALNIRYTKGNQFEFQAISPILNPLWEHVYGHSGRTTNGQRYKRITPELLEGLGIEAIALWIGDDGYMSKKDSSLILCCFQEIEEAKLIANWICSIIGPWAKPKIRKHRHQRVNKSVPGNDYGLAFSRYVTTRLTLLLKPYLPECIQYKLVPTTTPSGKTNVTRSILNLIGPQPLDLHSYLRLEEMTHQELRALARTLGIGCPRTVNGKVPYSKPEQIAHIKAHTYVLDPLEGRAA